MVEHFEALDRLLVTKGFPATSPWWKGTIRRWLTSGKRQLVARVGRRGGKSSTLTRLGVVLALYGGHNVPPGDRGTVAFVSVGTKEAKLRLILIKAVLDALGEPYGPTDDGFELKRRPFTFRVFACTVGAVSGFTAVAIIADEVAKWRSADDGANPAKEVLGSIRPTMATMPNGRIILSSSPFGFDDEHATSFDRGETDFQCVAFAESWVANPVITEASTHQDEPDERIWAREYAAVPSVTVSAAFDMERVGAAMRPPPPAGHGTYFPASLIIDAAGGGADAMTASFVNFFRPFVPLDAYEMGPNARDRFGNELLHTAEPLCDAFGVPRLSEEYRYLGRITMVVHEIMAFDTRQVAFDDVIAHLSGLAHRVGVRRVYGDQFGAYAAEASFRHNGLRFEVLPWTAPSKVEAVNHFRRMLNDETIVLPVDDELRKEFGTYQERLNQSGTFSYGAKSGRHDDRVAVVLTACMADLSGDLRGSPYRSRGGRRDASIEARTLG